MTASAEKQQPHLVVDSERPGAGVGAILRGARLARDEDLREVASALRIRLPYLQALEDGDVGALPGVTYGIGFVRAYAAYLDLNVEETVARFKTEVSGIHRRTQLSFPEPLPGNRVPGGALLLIVLILAGAVYSGWLYTSSQNMSFTEAVEQVPQRLMALLKQEEEALTAAEPASDAPMGTDATATETTSTEPTASDTMTTETAGTGGQAAEQPAATAAVSETPATEEPATEEPVAEAMAGTESDAAPSDAASAATPASPATETASAAVDAPGTESPTAEVTSAPEGVATETQTAAAPAPAATVAETAAAPDSAITVEELPNPPAAPAPPTASPPRASTSASESAMRVEAEGMDVAPSAGPEPSAAAAAMVDEQGAAATPSADVAASTATTPDPVAEPAAEPAAPSRIIVQATSDSWIQVTDTAGTVVYERLMLTGDIYRVPDREGLKLTTGNAGALKIVVDGTTIPPIGESGEVRRDIALTPDALNP